LTASGVQGFPDTLTMVQTVHMERTLALIQPHIPAAAAEESACAEVPPKGIQSGFAFHHVDISSKRCISGRTP
jgi:hypothetical protein